MNAYRLGSQAVLRITGFPVEVIDEFAAQALTAVIDRALEAERVAIERSEALLKAMRERKAGSGSQRKRVERLEPIEPGPELPAEPLDRYREALAARAAVAAEVEQAYVAEIERARRLLYDRVAEEHFRHVLLLSAPALAERTPTAPGS